MWAKKDTSVSSSSDGFSKNQVSDHLLGQRLHSNNLFPRSWVTGHSVTTILCPFKQLSLSYPRVVLTFFWCKIRFPVLSNANRTNSCTAHAESKYRSPSCRYTRILLLHEKHLDSFANRHFQLQYCPTTMCLTKLSSLDVLLLIWHYNWRPSMQRKFVEYFTNCLIQYVASRSSCLLILKCWYIICVLQLFCSDNTEKQISRLVILYLLF